MEWVLEMLHRKLKPQMQTFEILIQCLLQKDKLDDILVVLDLMLSMGYILQENTIHSLVSKFGQERFSFAETCLEKILE